MNKNETKYMNTARLMNEALLILLEHKNYEFITVKEICAKAGVNRSTFYLHYETMNDLLTESLAYITEKRNSRYQSDLMLNRERIENASLDKLMLITPPTMLFRIWNLSKRTKIFSLPHCPNRILFAQITHLTRFSTIILRILWQGIIFPSRTENIC